MTRPYMTFEEAQTRLARAIAEGRVRVMRGEETLSIEEGLAAFREGDPTISCPRDDVLREFPPMPPAGHA